MRIRTASGRSFSGLIGAALGFGDARREANGVPSSLA